MISIDSNRVNFEDLGVSDKAEEMGLLSPLVNIPVQNAGAYKNVEVDVAGEANKEDLVDVSDFGIKSVSYYRTQAENNPTYKKNISGAPDVNFVRVGTAKKLQEANKILNELDLELVVVDGHRSPVTQNILFLAFKEQFFEKHNCATSQITESNKNIIERRRTFYDEQAKNFALDFCSSAENFDSKNPKTWSIHSTGGAVDIYMIDKKSGRVVDMGEDYFDKPATETCTGYYESKDNLNSKEKGFRDARRVLYNTLSSLDFVNFGNECFHFSYQDQYWACVKGVNAKYGYKQSPKDNQLSQILSSVMEKSNNK